MNARKQILAKVLRREQKNGERLQRIDATLDWRVSEVKRDNAATCSDLRGLVGDTTSQTSGALSYSRGADLACACVILCVCFEPLLRLLKHLH